jgi:hypothetical protein
MVSLVDTRKRRRSFGRMTAWSVSGATVVIAVIVSISLISAKEPVTEEQLFGSSGARFADVAIDGPEYDSTDDIVAALAEGGVRCSELHLRSTSTAVEESAECQVQGDDVVIRVFATNEARNRYLATVESLVQGADVSGPPTVVGPIWLVITDTKATARKVEEALGGQSI